MRAGEIELSREELFDLVWQIFPVGAKHFLCNY